jgi:guanosine-3',5'-bis(diphosphate) 3'-pyrophosphohydrolase
MEVTDDKSLPKVERKKLQIEHAKTVSDAAKLVKIADKISNVKSTVLDPPDWSTETKVGYGVWSKAVVDNMRGVNKYLEDEFDKWFEKLLEDNGVPLASDFKKMLDDYYGSMTESKD